MIEIPTNPASNATAPTANWPPSSVEPHTPTSTATHTSTRPTHRSGTASEGTSMPRRPPSPCGHTGCPNLRPCPDHQRKPWESSSRKSKLTVSGSAEQARAQRILERDRYRCHVCRGFGADQVDHVICLAEDGPDDETNLAAIHSTPCHRDKTRAERARALARARGSA